ncbi:hypothetical protein GCK72_020713 [Caenorhabditis remanei]|uniref:GH18 domain-containing protein n=1 Tax=Caenorhabditis remanei TaxID=31234 RepID=A0A6A5GHJ4_CAERE|nr:hypothetical protein GCK72_020713 [Caenorhabditis remanei]KAF1754153.1 hypothetical protein GCK72_020713 [Caenorhabditis remanei]
MSGNQQVRYMNIASAQDAPPAYNHCPPEDALIMISVEKEIRAISKRHSRHLLIKKYTTGFLIGFLFCVIVFLISGTLWKKFETPNDSPFCYKRVIGYYHGGNNRKITEKQIEKLTHIIFDGVYVNSYNTMEFVSDEQRLTFLDMKNKVRTMKSDVKIMVSIDYWPALITDSKKRSEWIRSITNFILEQQLDGVHLTKGTPNSPLEKENYIFFIRELRYKLEKLEKYSLRKIPYIVSVKALSFSQSQFLIHDFLKYVDFLELEIEDPLKLHEITPPIPPLYSTSSNRSIDWTMNAFSCETGQPSKLNIIIPFRGIHWSQTSKAVITEHDEIYRIVAKHGVSYEVPWKNIERFGLNKTSAKWHSASMTPFISEPKNPELFLFENERSVVEKMKYVKDKNIGGVIIDKLDYDDDWNTLLNAVSSVELCGGEQKSDKDKVMYNF